MIPAFLSCLYILATSVAQNPRNVVAGKGDMEARMVCNYHEAENRKWMKNGNDIIRGDTPVDPARYRVITDGTPNYILIIYNIVFDDAGLYTCTDGENKTKSARLIVISKPNCSLSNKNSEQVVFTCIGEFGGDWGPVAEMEVVSRDVIDGEPIGTVVANKMWRSETLDVEDEDKLKCDLVITDTGKPDTSDVNVASTNPSMAGEKFQCETIAAEPYAVMITKPGSLRAKVGDILTCKAQGNPAPMYRWSTRNIDYLGTGPTFTMTEQFLDERLICSAFNNLGSANGFFPKPITSGAVLNFNVWFVLSPVIVLDFLTK